MSELIDAFTKLKDISLKDIIVGNQKIKLISKIFKNANYTILGDINQTINPYYKYKNLNTIKDLLPSSRYLELLKTYRSSEEIINYTNKILNLKHVSAIRRSNKKEIIQKISTNNIKNEIINDIQNLKKEYQSIAIITKTDKETNHIYNIIKDEINITKMNQNSETYKRDLIILPSYIAKGLEFDAVIIYTDKDNNYKNNEKYLFYVACTRAQHQLIIYNQKPSF